MIILPKALFCLNAKTTLNKWKATVKKKKKKKCSLTQLQFVGIKEEKMERGKSSNTSGHDLKPSPQSLFFCVNQTRCKMIIGKWYVLY